MALSQRALLIDAIFGLGFPTPEVGVGASTQGLARFTGNQWNEAWEWDREALGQLSEPVLAELHAGLKAFAEKSNARQH